MQGLVIQILNKAIDFKAKGRPLGITAVCAGKSKGIIYIEGFSEPLCLEALDGEVGSEGKLVVIDGDDAIFCKPEGEGGQDFKIVNVSDIARV